MTPEQMAEMALRHDTAMSRAMLRALGVRQPNMRSRRRRNPRQDPWRYRGARSCMRQRHSVVVR